MGVVKKRRLKKKRIIICLIGIVFIIGLGIFALNDRGTSIHKVFKEEKAKEKKLDLKLVKSKYKDNVKTLEGASFYVKNDNTYEVVSHVNGSVEVKLDPNYEIVDEYFKLLDSDEYISYNMVEGIDDITKKKGEYKTYSNYIVFNQNVNLKEKAKLYVDDNNYYEVNGGDYPIIIKDDNRYGIEYHKGLVYVNKEDVESVIDKENTNSEYTKGITVLNYHYVVSSSNENGELSECTQDICITDTAFDKHIGYLKENGYYGATMRDLELYIDGKVQLPKNTVVITIDDGWYVSRSITILEKYQMMGTLFLIGSLASPDSYRSDFLEIHSHTWDMHTIGQCPSSVGRGGILCLDENVILNDLKKSRESLDNTTYFCYPFYDYNERAIRLLKEAGFTMAFAGEKRDNKVRIGQDKYKIPRVVIVSYTTMNEFINYVS